MKIIILIFLCTLIHNSQCVRGTSFSEATFTKNEHMFIQTVYDTLKGLTKFECCSICHEDEICKSVNYKRMSKECELVSVPVSDWTIAYDVNWDVYIKSGTERTLVFRGTRGAGGDIYTAWVDGDTVTTHDVTCMTTDVTSCNQHYRNPLVDKWSSVSAGGLKVKYALFKGGIEVAYIIFNGTGSNVTTWFSQENVIESTWSNLKTTSLNHFSISGLGSMRRFYVNRSHAGCDSDTDYTMAIAPSAAHCDFDSPEVFPEFLYANTTTYGYPNQMIGMDRADVLAIYIMIG